jgi:hypothetical protein
LVGPEVGDQPALILGSLGQAMRGDDGKRDHRRRPATALG